jgi:CRISPR-associated endonuclease Csn1
MSRILGLDLGTNSIGWCIRETERHEREEYSKVFSKNITDFQNEIVDYGVVIFQKGVGEGKSGEFSLAAERRKNRSKRRLYNAKRYRKWELLKILVENKMCPLTLEELRLWSIGNWQEVEGKKKNLGRIYPVGNEYFQKWLTFDPVYFGQKGVSDNGKSILKTPYDLRCELICSEEQDETAKKQKVGRALYHLVQRRGFKSSRKNGKSRYAENAELEKIKLEKPNFHISTLAKEKIDEGKRFRASGVIQRKYFEDEFYAICEKQNIGAELTDRLYKAIYFVRPLRSQKGLVGNCTLEKRKTRIPISHPKYEEFRALQFINNIKWRKTGLPVFEPIPMQLKKKIFEELFFRRLESGKNKGKVHSESYFKFDNIIDKYSENGKYEFNYENKPNISACPIIASFMNVFDDEWQNKFIKKENSYGINWDGLSINYVCKYGKKNGQNRILKADEIWHLLFDYIQTKDKQEELNTFCKNVLEFNDDKSKEFSNIDIPQGYGSLSHNAVCKIIPFLQSGYIYSEAVSFANLKKVLGSTFDNTKEKAEKTITTTIKETSEIKEKLTIVNSLIQQFFSNNNTIRAKGLDNHIKAIAIQDTTNKLRSYFRESHLVINAESDRKKFETEILDLYLKFLDGRQNKDEKASSYLNKNPEIDYYRLPRLDEVIKQNLKKEFDLSDIAIKHLYHPSDIDMYPMSKLEIRISVDGIEQLVKQLGSPQPPSKGWKNPMAMRTLHELRHLLNYLLKVSKITPETKVVVEMARELNDANKRWAIQTYQRYREKENKEFAKAIVGVAKEKYPNIDETNIENINKVRLWWEQIKDNEALYKQIENLKEDVQKYRLWKEQECVCMYTGEMISLTDLFDGSQTHFEHTLPVSDSFDNSLANLTVCKEYYNTNIKKNKIPTQLGNYLNDVNGYTAIKPRLKKWEEKVEHLKTLIDTNKIKTKKTQDPETKKSLIQNRHLLQFDYDYWKKKLNTFIVKEIPNSWKNSQLIDTQIISKYARAYLKTVFEKVDVQKASITNDFKKIYRIKGNETKDRSKHSHHAEDAATLALIPGSARRETILKEYYEAIRNKKKYTLDPYNGFDTKHVLDIEKNITVFHVCNNKYITNTKKKNRKRGEIVFLKNKKTKKHMLNESGKPIPMIATGDTIRGQINEESYLGAITPPLYQNGKAVKKNNKWEIRREKNGNPEIWIVKRLPIDSINFEKDIIIDEQLKQSILNQINEGRSVNELTDLSENKIRHIRCRVKTGKGFQSREKTIELKKHSHTSKQEYKKNVLSKIADNFLCLFYQNKPKPDEQIQSRARIISLFHFRYLEFDSLRDIWNDENWNNYRINDKLSLPLVKIITQGTKVLFYEKSKDEIGYLKTREIQQRIFVVFKFNESLVSNKYYNYIYFKNHLDARPNPDIDKECEDKFDPQKYQSGLRLKPENINCLFEGIDFEMKPDGEIKWIKK